MHWYPRVILPVSRAVRGDLESQTSGLYNALIRAQKWAIDIVPEAAMKAFRFSGPPYSKPRNSNIVKPVTEGNGIIASPSRRSSALDDGFESVGFEVVARICGGLRVGVGADLNAKILVRAGGDDKGGKFFLLQRLREGHGTAFGLDGRDCVFRRLQMGPGIVDRQSPCCTRRNGHIGSQSW